MPGDADDDGDEVAFDEGMEPESATGDAPGDDDDAYDDGDGDAEVSAAAGGAVSRVISPNKGTRPVSDKVRQMMRDMAAKYKAAGGLEDELEPVDHEEAPMEPATPKPGETAPPPGDPAAAAAPPAPTPPAPSLDPEVTRLREEAQARHAELDAREKSIAEAERASDLTKLRELYFDKGAPAVVEMIKKWSGAASDEELKDELADLVTDLSIHLGVQVPPEVRDRLDMRRTKKGVKVWKADQERAKAEATERAKAAQEEQDRVRVKGILQQEIIKPEHEKAFPWLAAEPNAGEIILDVVEAALKKDGTQLKWTEAAKRANDYLQSQSLAWIDKRKHLLPTATGQAAAPNGQQQRTQGDQQVRRSQAPPAKPPTQPRPTPPVNGKWDPDAHRKAVKAKFRTAFTRTDEE